MWEPQWTWLADSDSWVETAGEIELIGGWAEIAFAEKFAAAVDTSRYQVFVTSYDAAPVFVQNRTPKGFEIHAMPRPAQRLPRTMRCAYRVIAKRRER